MSARSSRRRGADRDDAGAEERRLGEAARRERNWQRFGPYLAERQWATVREDYSADGTCWDYFPHDHARSRAYRWGEDGLLGITDRECRLCIAVALWNGRDPFLKERLFGLTGPQGNHGEDAKEVWFHLDSSPTHSYMAGLYRYPQAVFPYERLVEENRRRGRNAPEAELADLGVFRENRFFDVLVEYAKASPDDVLGRITITNRGPEPAEIHWMPTTWFRNTWTWGCAHEGCEPKPYLGRGGPSSFALRHVTLGEMRLDVEALAGAGPPPLLFTENETNFARIFGSANPSPWVKDAFHEWVVRGRKDAVNPAERGTKGAAHYRKVLAPGASVTSRLRLTAAAEAGADPLGPAFEQVFADRMRECDAFYASRIPEEATDEERSVARRAYAELLWGKQFYHFSVRDWLDGDPEQPPPPASRREGRNREWRHLFLRDVISVPDPWEYPWFAAWDLAFHMVALAPIDPEFAKNQIVLMLREWTMHANGQMPAYEFEFGDVNPPVHAWAAWRVYKTSAPKGHRDRRFLARVFHKLLINFTWWVNRKDAFGRNLFAGGFLGLDNVGVFDRSKPLPGGGVLEQADGTAWMAFYCATMLAIALELAREDSAYEDVASKFFEHFVTISDAMNTLGGTGLWDPEDGFYYDLLHAPDGQAQRLRIRSMVGIIPLFACEVLDFGEIDRLPGFTRRLEWFLEHRGDLAGQIAYLESAGSARGRRLLAIPSRERLVSVLRYVLDEREFLSPFGVRSLSAIHGSRPYEIRIGGEVLRLDYEPGESSTGLFGGNSNWRGPVWFPVNYLLADALGRYYYFYGDELKVELPAGSGRTATLQEVSDDLFARLSRLFVPGADGRRPCQGDDPRWSKEPLWRGHFDFPEYFHGETGKGLGASHQGWTALVARCIEKVAKARRR